MCIRDRSKRRRDGKTQGIPGKAPPRRGAAEAEAATPPALARRASEPRRRPAAETSRAAPANDDGQRRAVVAARALAPRSHAPPPLVSQASSVVSEPLDLVRLSLDEPETLVGFRRTGDDRAVVNPPDKSTKRVWDYYDMLVVLAED